MSEALQLWVADVFFLLKFDPFKHMPAYAEMLKAGF